MSIKYNIKAIIKKYSDPEMLNEKIVSSLKELEYILTIKENPIVKVKVLDSILPIKAFDNIQICSDYFHNNKAENYPTDDEYQDYLNGNKVSKADIVSVIDDKQNNKTDTVKSNDAEDNKNSSKDNDNTQLDEAKLSKQLLEIIDNKFTEMQALSASDNLLKKIDHKLQGLNERIDHIQNVNRNITSLDEVLKSTLELVPIQTNDLKKEFKYITDYCKNLSSDITKSISDELDLLKSSQIHKRIADFGINLNDELNAIQSKNKKMADTIALEIMNEASTSIHKMNNEFIDTSVRKNKNILVYGLITSFILSVLTGAFVGKLVGNSTGTATINYLQNKFDDAAKQKEQSELNQLRSQVKKQK